MRPLVTRVVETIQRSGLAGPGDRVLVALSGGPDSVALLWLLREALPDVGADLAGVAHLNHRLRGRESSADEAFCQTLAGQLGLRCDVERCDVGALAASLRRSVEAVAHDVRYEFLERARVRLAATLVATGHTANDQAETMLWHLARGTGVRGLAGIRYRRGRIVRPLLDLSRPELEEWLGERGLAFRLDASNQDGRFTRNRIRHQVLPALTAAVSARALEALARAARLAADEDAFLEEAVTQAARTVVLRDEEGGRARLDLAGLRAQPVALQRRLVWGALERCAGRRPIGAAHVDLVLAMVGNSAHAGRQALPGQWVAVEGGTVTFARRGPEDEGGTGAFGPATERRPLPVPGTLEDPSGRWMLSVRPATPGSLGDGWTGGPERVVADAVVGTELFVRSRRPGDRLAPVGLGGHKKLQDLFVDRKVPRQERDSVPLVVDGQDRIIWVAGHALAREARVTAGTTSVLLFEVRRSGGQG